MEHKSRCFKLFYLQFKLVGKLAYLQEPAELMYLAIKKYFLQKLGKMADFFKIKLDKETTLTRFDSGSTDLPYIPVSLRTEKALSSMKPRKDHLVCKCKKFLLKLYFPLSKELWHYPGSFVKNLSRIYQ